ncbi:ABC transporter permease [Salisediminibacterium halotolerans]|uniref:Putative hemin transport system permease protein HrtB n=1 Tax=Salisediminibacterium halotolerans TaxID=517425 RepID=A0A1H9U8Q1_9BACI|nr:ABC transporter permease [Salisediminibacterium haloalkalitolerans]SES05641.1 ABC-type antimicrobial peptide transport system, permease component [Salisediminibacterium haloalkalitolerans]
MYIAFKEMKKHLVRTTMMIILISLTATLVLLLSGLAEGLSKGMNGAVMNLRGNLVITSEEAEDNLSRSVVPEEIADALIAMPGADDAAPVGHRQTVVYKGGEQQNAALFGYEPETMGEPIGLEEGRYLEETDRSQVVVDRTFAELFDSEIGDAITLQDYEESFEIVGITGDNRFSMQPGIFIPLTAWKDEQPDDMDDLTTFISVQGPYELPDESAKDGISMMFDDYEDGGVQVQTREEAAMGIPGVQEMYLVPTLLQVLSYGLTGVIIAVFFYIQLVQKRSQFIVLKALGADHWDLFKIILAQMGMFVFAGMAAGFTLAYVGHLFMPPTLNVRITWEAVIGSASLFIIIAAATLPMFLSYLKRIPEDPDRTL